MTTKNILKILPVNKTVVFYSPLESKDVLVRTGTIGDGSCYYHALLHAYSNEYSLMNIQDRSKFVHRLRASMSDKIDKEKWQEIGGGLIAKIPFQEKLNSILVNFYRFINSDDKVKAKYIKNVVNILICKDQEKLELYELITELIPLNIFEKNILPEAYTKSENENIDEIKKEILIQTLKYFNNIQNIKQIEIEKINYIYNILTTFINVITDEAEDMSFNDYVNNLKNISDQVDTYTIGLISDRFNRDVYFIDANTRMPYQTSDTNNIKNRKSLIVIWIDQNHYEIVGKLLTGNRIQREFEPDDPLIKKINMILFQPQYIKKTYPELLSYLPKEYRQKIKEESKHYYDQSDHDQSDHDQSDDDLSSN